MDRRAAPEVDRLAQDIAALARRILGDGIEVLWFGSWARGNATPRSDIDLAVSTREPIDPTALARLRDAIDELRTLRTIELVDLASAGEALRGEIRRDGIAL